MRKRAKPREHENEAKSDVRLKNFVTLTFNNLKKIKMTAQTLRKIDPVNLGYTPTKELIQDLAKVLEKHNALSRFGITLNEKVQNLKPGESFMEYTSVDNRTQLIKPVENSILQEISNIETSWTLETGVPLMACNCSTGRGENGHQHYPNN